MGSKKMIAKEILSIMIKDDIGDRYFIDCFTGGGNLIQHVKCKNKIASDINKYVIAFLDKIKSDTSWLPKNNTEFTKEDYIKVKNNKDNYPDWLVAIAGYSYSFGGKWFGGYAKNNTNTEYIQIAYRHTLKQASLIKDVTFVVSSYDDLIIPPNSIIYCDPPYKNTTKYNQNDKEFDYDKFYDWCRTQKLNGHEIYVSEYEMPSDFKCVWQKEIKKCLNAKLNIKVATEKLFTL